MSILSRNFLRRRDARRHVTLEVIVECREVAQKVRVTDYSVSGLRLDGIQGLAPGDPIEILLAPSVKLKGKVAWAVWHKAGVKLDATLSEDHPALALLNEQAKTIERDRTRALVALAKEQARN